MTFSFWAFFKMALLMSIAYITVLFLNFLIAFAIEPPIRPKPIIKTFSILKSFLILLKIFLPPTFCQLSIL